MAKNSDAEHEPNARMTERGHAPVDESLVSWIGPAYKWWKRVAAWIAETYPGVFSPEWLFGGAKHGWSLRYKKGRSFCTFVPEKRHFLLVIVFGAEERAKVEAIRPSLSKDTRRRYDDATTYHDGKWLLLSVENEDAFADVQRLLAVKRKPKVGRLPISRQATAP